MSRRIGNVVVIEEEPDLICFECGKVTETRPYGPNGEEICHDCAMKDELTTMTQMFIRLFGESLEKARENAAEWMARNLGQGYPVPRRLPLEAETTGATGVIGKVTPHESET